VLATGPGNPPAVRFLPGGTVRFGSVPDPAKNPNPLVLAGLIPGPDIEPWVLAGLEPDHGFKYIVPTPLAPIMYLSSDRIVI